eukprot:3993682-Pleurochrysis_carterae.AAC.1
MIEGVSGAADDGFSVSAVAVAYRFFVTRSFNLATARQPGCWPASTTVPAAAWRFCSRSAAAACTLAGFSGNAATATATAAASSAPSGAVGGAHGAYTPPQQQHYAQMENAAPCQQQIPFQWRMQLYHQQSSQHSAWSGYGAACGYYPSGPPPGAPPVGLHVQPGGRGPPPAGQSVHWIAQPTTQTTPPGIVAKRQRLAGLIAAQGVDFAFSAKAPRAAMIAKLRFELERFQRKRKHA